MAITLRTVLSSPAPAAVAAVSFFGMAVMATQLLGGAPYTATQPGALAEPCSQLEQKIGADSRKWSEAGWVVYASCFERRSDSRAVVEVAEDGLRRFPRSEVLYNMKGYHELELGEHRAAVRTLSRGLSAVGEPQTGSMENNLAWAALWTGDLVASRGRELYESALTKEPGSCEILHTGLMVEYEAAKEGAYLDRAEALKKFESLRVRYERCESRIDGGDWKTLAEVVGASVLYDEMDRMMGIARSPSSPNPSMAATARELRERYRGAWISNLCREAVPMAELHGSCAEAVHEAVQQARREEQARLERREQFLDEAVQPGLRDARR